MQQRNAGAKGPRLMEFELVTSEGVNTVGKVMDQVTVRSIAICLLTSAICACSGFAQSRPPQYDDLIAQAQNKIAAKQLDDAGRLAAAAIDSDASRWQGYALVGSILGLQKRYQQAGEFLQKALDRAPQDRKPALQQAIDQARTASTSESATSLFNGSPPLSQRSSEQTTTISQAEVVLWKTIEHSKNLEDLRVYLRQYPNGAFAALAKSRLDAEEHRQNEDLRANPLKPMIVWMETIHSVQIEGVLHNHKLQINQAHPTSLTWIDDTSIDGKPFATQRNTVDVRMLDPSSIVAGSTSSEVVGGTTVDFYNGLVAPTLGRAKVVNTAVKYFRDENRLSDGSSAGNSISMVVAKPDATTGERALRQSIQNAIAAYGPVSAEAIQSAEADTKRAIAETHKADELAKASFIASLPATLAEIRELLARWGAMPYRGEDGLSFRVSEELSSDGDCRLRGTIDIITDANKNPSGGNFTKRRTTKWNADLQSLSIGSPRITDYPASCEIAYFGTSCNMVELSFEQLKASVYELELSGKGKKVTESTNASSEALKLRTPDQQSAEALAALFNRAATVCRK